MWLKVFAFKRVLSSLPAPPLQDRAHLEASSTNPGALSLPFGPSLSHVRSERRRREFGAGGSSDRVIHLAPAHASPPCISACSSWHLDRGKKFLGFSCHFPAFTLHSKPSWLEKEGPALLASPIHMSRGGRKLTPPQRERLNAGQKPAQGHA